jgi:hypothetical protein
VKTQVLEDYGVSHDGKTRHLRPEAYQCIIRTTLFANRESHGRRTEFNSETKEYAQNEKRGQDISVTFNLGILLKIQISLPEIPYLGYQVKRTLFRGLSFSSISAIFLASSLVMPSKSESKSESESEQQP